MTFEDWGDANEIATDSLMEETMTQSEIQEEVQPLAERAMFDLTVALRTLEESISEYVARPGIRTAPILDELAFYGERLDRIRALVKAR